MFTIGEVTSVKITRGRLYGYPLSSRILRLFLIFSSLFAVIVGGHHIVRSLSLLSQGLSIEGFITEELKGAFVFSFGIIATLLSLNWDPNLKITNSGIQVQFFVFWKRSIPWDEIQEIRQAMLFSKMRLVVVKRLTPIHRLYGLMYGFMTKPCIIIRGVMKDYDEAVKLLRSRIERT